MKIQKVLPIQDRQYQDQQGQQRVFTSMGFVLTDGVDTLFAEATGDYARSLVGYLNEGDTVRTQLSMGVRDRRLCPFACGLLERGRHRSHSTLDGRP